MSQGSLGSMFMEFGGDDSQLQSVAGRVEKEMAAMAKQMQKQAAEIDDALAKSAAGVARIPDEVAKSMRKTSAQLKKDAKDIELSLSRMGGAAEKTIGPVRRLMVAFYGKDLINSTGAALKRVGETAAEMSIKFRTGQASAGELTEELAKSIPLIGNFIAAGRGIRELITGENALTAAIQRNAEAQLRRVELMAGLIARLKELRRYEEDVRTQMGTPPGASPFVTGAKAIVTKGLRKAEDSTLTPEEDVRKLAEIQKERDKLLDRLTLAKDTSVNAKIMQRLFGKEDVESLQSQLRSLDAMAQTLRDRIAEIRKVNQQLNARETFTGLGQLVGDELAAAVAKGGAAIARYLGSVQKMQDQTRTAVDAMQSNWDRYFQDFRGKLTAFQVDFKKGLIDEKTLKAITERANWDHLAKSIERARDAMKPLLGILGAGALQSFNAAPFINVVDQVKQMFSGFGGKPKETKEFRSEFVGLEDMGRRIQQAAASRTDAIAEKQLAVQQKTGIDIAKVVTVLAEIKKNTGTVRPAVVGKLLIVAGCGLAVALASMASTVIV